MRESDFLGNCGYCKNREAVERPVMPHAEERLDIPAVIGELDRLFAAERLADARSLLEASLERSRVLGDCSGELSILSELMGFHRRSGDAEAARRACRDGIALIGELKLGSAVSGATVLLNAATTLAAYGEPAEAVGLFEQVSRVYSANLDPRDYRFAGLYNNMGTAYAALGDFERSRGYYLAALKLLRETDNREEVAVTHVNIAQIYDSFGREDRDEQVELHVSSAIAELDASPRRDGYHAFTCRKCAPTLDRLGYFFDAKRLDERADAIYAGN